MKLTRRQALGAAGAMIGSPLLATSAGAQAWPTRTIHILHGFAPGGLVDTSARVYGDFIQRATGQAVVVEAKPGAAGALAAKEAARAAPDGYTLLYTINSAMTVSRVLYKNLGYDPDKDFTLISYMPVGNALCSVRTDTGIRNVKDLVEYARKNRVNAGAPGPGSFSHMGIVELNRLYNLKIETVFYRGESPGIQALMAGDLHLYIGTQGGAAAGIEKGLLRPIAVTGDKRARRLPDVPTFHEQGVTADSFRLTSYLCVVAPAGLPEPLAQRLSDLFVQAGTSDRVQKFMDAQQMDEPALGRAAFRQVHEREGPAWIKLAQSLGLAPQ
jgi:tripartite-type tricarboxylate transporter receptor subunit TctC